MGGFGTSTHSRCGERLGLISLVDGVKILSVNIGLQLWDDGRITLTNVLPRPRVVLEEAVMSDLLSSTFPQPRLAESMGQEGREGERERGREGEREREGEVGRHNKILHIQSNLEYINPW